MKHEVVAGVEITETAFNRSIEKGLTTRDAVYSAFGRPWQYYQDVDVAAYYWSVRKGYLIQTLLVGMGSPEVDDITSTHYLFIKFDPSGRVANFTFKTSKSETRGLVDEWLRKK